MNNEFLQTLLLTAKLASVTTICLLLIGVPIAYGLFLMRSKSKAFLEAIVSLPLILPPTVLGFYLLLLFGQDGPIGSWLLDQFDVSLVFTFQGLVLGSIIYSLPFMVQPIQAGLESLPSYLTEASYVLGKTKIQTFFKVLLPNINPSILTGIVLSFAHTVGEFGVILMIGGNIPGRTKVASIAVYDEVEQLNYAAAHQYSLILLFFSFLILSAVYWLNKRKQIRL
ncbi:MAG: molybdate ABC transporter permease subunit [Bacteroidota bacterium]